MNNINIKSNSPLTPQGDWKTISFLYVSDVDLFLPVGNFCIVKPSHFVRIDSAANITSSVDGNSPYRLSISAALSVRSSAQSYLLHCLADSGRFIVCLTDVAGNSIVYGTKEQPLRFSFSEPDNSATTITFSGDTSTPPLMLR